MEVLREILYLYLEILLNSLLDQLRRYAPTIGSYIKSVYTTDFDYSVKLSNGRIRLPEELVDDYEKSPALVAGERLKQAARQFSPNESEVTVAPAEAPVFEDERPGRSSSWKPIVIVVILIVVGFCWFNSARKANALAAARSNIYHQIIVENSNYMVNRLFGGISGLRITVTNNSDYLVDIVKVKVTYIKADGDLYKEELLYFNRLDEHSTQTLDAPESDRGTSVRITTESLSCAALQIN